MATEMTNYQCPACTAPLHFVGASGKLECDYCGGSYTVEEVERLYAEKEAASAAVQEKKEAQAARAAEAGDEVGDRFKTYSCPSCGAELLCDETTSATSCPYCGNNGIVAGQFRGEFKPDYVLPFKLDKDAAIAALRKHYSGKVLLPRAFSDENHISEIKGVYVPFWLYDGEAEAEITCHATNVSAYSTKRENVTVTNHYAVRRGGTVAFERVPVDASSKMPDDHMDAIEPFDYADLKPFSTAYLPGFFADRYDVSAEDCAERAEVRCRETAVELLRADAAGSYTACTVENSEVSVKREAPRCALLPVWMLSTQWNGQSFLFAMNGQTGRLVGDLPLDRGRYWKYFGGIAAGVLAVCAALGVLLL